MNKLETSPVTSLEEQAADYVSVLAEGESKVVKLPNGIDFEPDKIYRLKSYPNEWRIFYLQENRKVSSQIDAKLESCEKVGIQTPISFVYPAAQAKDLGFHVLDAANGCEVADAEALTKGLLIKDGNTRFWGWIKSLDKANSDKNYKAFTLPFTVELITSKEEFMNAYTEINKVQKPTTTSDYSAWYMSTSDNEVVKAYRDLTKWGLCPKAAGYAVVGEEIVKTQILNALKGKASVFDKEERLEWFLPIVKQLKETLSAGDKPPVLMKQTTLWKFIGTKVLKAESGATESAKIVKLFDEIRSKDLTKLIEACKLKGASKDVTIEGILNSIYKGV